jgi:hypothetical protein
MAIGNSLLREQAVPADLDAGQLAAFDQLVNVGATNAQALDRLFDREE